jgi:uncharacterized protein (TIGR02646 family)
VKEIVKRTEPADLTAYRQVAGSNYDGYQQKDELRNSLAAEQGALCCYCMGRIEPEWDEMKIEHWRSQTKYPADQLTYLNLLGGCMGGQGQPYRKQHCDTHKGDADLQYNPADPAHHVETRILYLADGTIQANDAVFDKQLNDVLNLNLELLKNSRKSVLTAILEWWRDERDRLHRAPSKARIQEELDQRTGGVGGHSPFCQVAVWWLEQKLAGMA